MDEAQVDPTATFVDDLGADSLDIVELVMAFEEAFDLDIPDEDAEKIATVKNAVDYIESKKAKIAISAVFNPAISGVPNLSRRVVVTGVGTDFGLALRRSQSGKPSSAARTESRPSPRSTPPISIAALRAR